MLNFKRILSFLLVLTMLVGMVPSLTVRADELEAAEETNPTEAITTPVEETSCAEETTAATETESVEETVTTPPTTELDTSEPVTDPVEPTEETLVSSDVPAKAYDETNVFAETASRTLIGSGNCGADLNEASLQYAFYSDGTVVITGSGIMRNYSIVSASPWYSLSYNNDIPVTNVLLPDGLTHIGEYAFSISDIKEITIPQSVQSIGHHAFFACDSLDEIIIPAGVTLMGESVFYNCSNLSKVTVSAQIADLPEYTFYGCKKLETVILPETLSTIGIYCFYGCETLPAIELPETLTGIGKYAFYSCEALKSIVIPQGVTIIDEYTFSVCESLEQVVLPAALKQIGKRAFSSCTALKDIQLNQGLEYIGGWAFTACRVLEEINIPSSVTFMDSNIFYNCISLSKVTVSAQIADLPESTFYGCKKLETVILPETLSTIGIYCFYGCEKLPAIELPETLSGIGKYAFYSCEALKSIVIPHGVTTIDEYTFSVCESLEQVVLPAALKQIGERAFSGCEALKDIQLNQGLEYIGGWAFTACRVLEEINIPSSVTFMDSNIFYNCISLSKVTVSAQIADLPESTFYGCKKLETVILPETLTRIGKYAFCNCDCLVEITLPATVASIEDYAFSSDNTLSKIFFTGNAPVFQNGADGKQFQNVTAIAYYPEAGTGWTEDVMLDYGGNIAWMAYADEIPENLTCQLSELTDLDYLAFAKVAYVDFDVEGETVRHCLERQDGNKWDDVWGMDEILWSELCDHIAYWRVCEIGNNMSNGFYAVAFENDYGEIVIGYRGSYPSMFAAFTGNSDAYYDWRKNDFPMIIFNKITKYNQFQNAIDFYDSVAVGKSAQEIHVTGHSLGGLWGDVVSGYSGCKGVTFNAISALDIIYSSYVTDMGKNFHGVDAWNFKDCANENDLIAGVMEEKADLIFGNRLKPYIRHVDNDYNDNIFGAHSVENMVIRKNDIPVMTDTRGKWVPSDKISNYMSFTNNEIDLCTTAEDIIDKPGSILRRISYGGDGNDIITTGWDSDNIIGGSGNDLLDGGIIADIYYYYKGDGIDFITDISGKDRVVLLDFSDSDEITVSTNEGNYIEICCNGAPITRIDKNRRNNSRYNSFTVRRIFENGSFKDYNIEYLFNHAEYSYSYTIECPVYVEILDAEDKVIYTLRDDEVGNFYTEYGNFYVYEAEDGGYGKALDLLEGYTVRIKGYDSGTMNIRYCDMEDGELEEEVKEFKQFAEVPVSAEFSATFEETEDGEQVLAADTDGDGFVDAKIGYDGQIIPVEAVSISQEYLAMKPADTIQLASDVQPAVLTDLVHWSIEAGGEDIITVDENGTVTALNFGTAYILATVDSGVNEVTARCRIDVAETILIDDTDKIVLDGIQLSTAKLTSELNSTAYAKLEVLLKLPQNYTASATSAQIPDDLGVAIESARFADETAKKHFDLIPLDDRTLAVVPTEYAVSNPKEVASSYKSSIIVTVNDRKYESEILKLSVKKSNPKLKVSVGAFNSFYAGQSQDLVITGATVTGVELDPSMDQPNWLTLKGQVLYLNENAPAANASGKVYLLVHTEQWRTPVAITLNVKNTYKAAKLKLSASSVTLNTAVKDAATVTLTANPADFNISDPSFRLMDSTGKVDKTGELTIGYENGTITVGTTPGTNGKYKLFVSVGNTKEVALTIKTVSKMPAVTFKVTGNLDLNLPNQTVQIKPTFKNYSSNFSVAELTVKTTSKQDISKQFQAGQVGDTIQIACEENTPVGSYTLKLKLALADGSTVENTAKVSVKKTVLKLKLSASKLTLNKSIGDSAAITVTSATKGYEVTPSPVWYLMDKSGKNPTEGKLTIGWSNGKLTVSTNDATEYGATYKLLVYANADAPASAVTITIPAQSKSAVTATLKAAGKIDVIRDGSAVTLTPTYKNANAPVWEETLVFYKVVGKKLEAADGLFAYASNGNGGYTISKAEGAQLDHNCKYQVKLITSMDDAVIAESKAVSLSVKQGNTKLTLTATDTVLFHKDIHDRVEFTLDTTDKELNAVSRVEIKDAKLKDKFEIIDYGNGQYAIGFKDDKADSSLIGKTVTVNLNIYLDGNLTAKANATAKLKLTIQK